MENIEHLESVRDINNDNQLTDRTGQNLSHLRKNFAISHCSLDPISNVRHELHAPRPYASHLQHPLTYLAHIA